MATYRKGDIAWMGHIKQTGAGVIMWYFSPHPIAGEMSPGNRSTLRPVLPLRILCSCQPTLRLRLPFVY